jgi:hypothetical protein
MILKKGMLVKAKSNLTITKDGKQTKDFLTYNQLCLIVDVLEEKNKATFFVFCETAKKQSGLKTIVIPCKAKKIDQTTLGYFSIVA